MLNEHKSNGCLMRTWKWVADHTYRRCLRNKHRGESFLRQAVFLENNPHSLQQNKLSPPSKDSKDSVAFSLNCRRQSLAKRKAVRESKRAHLGKNSSKNIESEDESKQKEKEQSFCPQEKKKMGITLLKKYINLKGREKPTSLLCPICFDLFVGSTVLNCGHVFCRKCIDEGMLGRRVCPLCRAKASWRDITLSECIQIETVLRAYVCLFAPDDQIQENYAEQRVSLANWSKRRSTSQLEVSSMVDYYIKSDVWLKGEIVKIFVEGNSKWFEIREQKLGGSIMRIQANSSMLARGGFYTSRGNYLTNEAQIQQNVLLDAVYLNWLTANGNRESPIDVLPQIQEEVGLQEEEMED